MSNPPLDSRYVELTRKFLELQRSPEQQAESQKKVEKFAVDRYAQTGMGRYKLDLMFGADRSIVKPFVGQLQFFESGAYLSGQGDIKIFLCPGKERAGNECSAFIPSAANQYGSAVCPKCQLVWTDEEVWGEVVGKHTVQNWAKLLNIYFHRFNCDVDVYIKYARKSLKGAFLDEQKNPGANGDILARAEEDIQTVIYPLSRILQDSRHTDVESVFKAFLSV